MNTPDRPHPGAASRGVLLAFCAAGVSGVAVFVNAYGVRSVGDATVYTTGKNLVAAVILIGTFAVLAAAFRPTTPSPTASAAGAGPGRLRAGQRGALAAVAVFGGSVPFLLFFEGLARASSTQAAFVHKTLVLWVAALAVPLLGERLRAIHVVAIAALLAGQAVLAGGLADFRLGAGEIMLFGATLMWSVEIVLVKRLLRELRPRTVVMARMGAGSVVLVAWVAATGRWSQLTGLDRGGWLWVFVTGAILAGYVSLWFSALALAPAIDVTAALVLAAAVTGMLDLAIKGSPVTAWNATGLAIILTGAALVAVAGYGRRMARPAVPRQSAAS